MRLRLPGASAASLDAYLRGLGLVRVCDRALAEPSLRWSWDRDGILVVHGLDDIDALVAPLLERAVEDVDRLFAPLATPWRGREGKELSFRELRNEAPDEMLDWFDACGVAQTGKGDVASRHNPLLGQGGGFGRSEVADGATAAREKLRKAIVRPDRPRSALRALLLAQAVDPTSAKAVQVNKKVIGVYQSGRGTGPGASRQDVNPSGQAATTSAWDLLLVIEGLRHFRGALVRRPGSNGREQASFPLIARAAAIGLGAANAKQDRADDDRAYEVLAPLWSAPLRASTVSAAIARARLRLRGGWGVQIAGDALDAVVAAGASAELAGFDRVVRFALHAPSDPRYRYALLRGSAPARGLLVARRAISDVLPFVRNQSRREPRGENRTAAHRQAEHELEERLADLANAPHREPEAARGMVRALVALERIGARAHRQEDLERLQIARLGADWARAARRGDGVDATIWRLARAIASVAAHATLSRGSWLRDVLLPHRAGQHAWRLDDQCDAVDLARAADPVGRLLEEATRHGLSAGAGAIRAEGDLARASAASPGRSGPPVASSADPTGGPNGAGDPLARHGESIALSASGGASARDLAYLLACDASSTPATPDGFTAAIATAVPAAARVDLESRDRTARDPRVDGPPVGAASAWLLLAAQPSPSEAGQLSADAANPALARRARLAALAHRGDLAGALRIAVGELRARGVERGAPGPAALAGTSGERLALALLLGLSAATIAGLQRQIGLGANESEIVQVREGSKP